MCEKDGEIENEARKFVVKNRKDFNVRRRKYIKDK